MANYIDFWEESDARRARFMTTANGDGKPASSPLRRNPFRERKNNGFPTVPHLKSLGSQALTNQYIHPRAEFLPQSTPPFQVRIIS